MQNADFILIPLLDGAFSLAQIDTVSRDENGAPIARILLTGRHGSRTSKPDPIKEEEVLAVLTTYLLDATWEVIGYDAIPRLTQTPVLDDLLGKAHPQDPAILEALANAIQCWYPWDGFPDPDFFTKMLVTPDTLPPRARMASEFPQPEA